LVCFGCDPTPKNDFDAVEIFRSFFSECGFKDSRVEVWGQSKLIGYFEFYPSISLKITQNEGAYKSHDRWSFEELMTVPLHLGEVQQEFISEVRELLIGTTIRHVRVLGEPGLGKTRLVLEATKDDSLRPYVVYIRDAEDLRLGPLLDTLLQRDNPYRAILVVDECSNMNRMSVWKQLKDCGDRIRLVTLDHGPDDSKDSEMKVLYAPKLAAEQIKQIIQGYVPDSFESGRWVEECGGSPRVANVVGRNPKENPENYLGEPATVQVWDSFIHGRLHSSDNRAVRREVVLRCASLLEKFGIAAPFEDENAFVYGLVRKIDPSISLPQFAETIEELQRGKILQGRKTVFITPKLLQVYLWIGFWEKYGNAFTVRELMRGMPPSLLGWFAPMFKYTHSSERAKERVSEFLDDMMKSGGTDDLFSESGCKFLCYFAEGVPKEVLTCLHITIGNWSEARLNRFREGRFWIVQALQNLAVWPEYFEKAAEVLLKLAEFENDSYSNNATGTFSQLFSLSPGQLAPTGAAPSIRFPVLERAMLSDSLAQREVALKAAGVALAIHNRHGRFIGPEYQGLRPQADLWSPKVWDEIFEPCRIVWKMVYKKSRGWVEEERQKANDVLIKSAYELIQVKALAPMVIDTLEELLKDKSDNLFDLGRLIRRSDRHLEEALDETTVERLDELDLQLTGTTYDSRLNRWVIITDWSDAYPKGGKSNEELLKEIRVLVDETIENIALLLPNLELLLRSQGAQIHTFGYELGLRDNDQLCLKLIVESQLKIGATGLAQFLGAYLQHVRERDLKLWEEILLRFMNAEDMSGVLGDLMHYSGLSERVFEECVQRLETGSLTLKAIEPLTRGSDSCSLSGTQVSRALSVLKARGDRDSLVQAIQLSHAFYCECDDPEPMPEEILMGIIAHSQVVTNDPDTNLEYDWSVLAKAFCEQHEHRSVDLLRSVLSKCDSWNTPFVRAHSGAREALYTVVEKYPEDSWDAISSLLTDQRNEVAYSIHEFLRGENFESNDSLLLKLPRNLVWNWIDGDIESRAPFIAGALPNSLKEKRNWNPISDFLVRYGDNEEVRHQLLHSFRRFGWSGTAVKVLESKIAEATALRGTELHPNVDRWISEYVGMLNDMVTHFDHEEERRH
jgi:hypothetical protein